MLLSGETGNLDEIYRTYFPNIRSSTVVCGGSGEEALYIFNTALLAIYQNAQQENFELHCSFLVYLNTVCYEIWSNRNPGINTAGLYPIPFYPREEKHASINASIMEQAAGDLFWLILNSFPEQERSILQLSFAGKSIQEIQQIFRYESFRYTRVKIKLCKKKLVRKIKTDYRIHQNIYWSVWSRLEKSEQEILLLLFINKSITEVQHTMGLESSGVTQTTLHKAIKKFEALIGESIQQYKSFFWVAFAQLEREEQYLLCLHYAQKSYVDINKLMVYPSVEMTKNRVIQCKKKLVALILGQHKTKYDG
jgi:hypothetical protein